jgi:hypothetical protein
MFISNVALELALALEYLLEAASRHSADTERGIDNAAG